MNKICINSKNYKLTEGKVYSIIEENNGYYFLVNDNNRTVRYDSSLFEDEAHGIVPPPPPARTEADCINSISQNTNSISYVDLNNETITINTTVTREGSYISCGVKEVVGLNGVMYNILDNVDTEEDDMLDLIDALFRAALENIKSQFPACRFLLLSTNNDTAHEDFFTILDSESVSHTEWENNPNSGNDIKVWILQR